MAPVGSRNRPSSKRPAWTSWACACAILGVVGVETAPAQKWRPGRQDAQTRATMFASGARRANALPGRMPHMADANTTAAIQHYLDDLAGARSDSPAEPVVRALLARAVDRLHFLCSA